MTDGFACLRVWANDAFTYKVSRNGVMDRGYTVRFEILNKDGVCVVVNPPVVDLIEMNDEIEAQLELAEYFKMQDKRKARIAELEATITAATIILAESGVPREAKNEDAFNVLTAAISSTALNGES